MTGPCSMGVNGHGWMDGLWIMVNFNLGKLLLSGFVFDERLGGVLKCTDPCPELAGFWTHLMLWHHMGGVAQNTHLDHPFPPRGGGV